MELRLTRLSQERIRREIRHFAQSVQSNVFFLKLGPLGKVPCSEPLGMGPILTRSHSPGWAGKTAWGATLPGTHFAGNPLMAGCDDRCPGGGHGRPAMSIWVPAPSVDSGAISGS